MDQSDILVQRHLPNLTQLKKMGTPFDSFLFAGISSQLYSITCIVLYAELGYYVNYCLLLTNAELGYYVNYYCLLLTCKVICPDLRGMACWHPLQLAGRAMTCIH